MPSCASERDDLALGADLRPLAAEPEHARLRVAPHVRVEHADALALGRQRGRQVRRHRRLADAALAGADADDVRDLRERAGRQPAAAAELAGCSAPFSASDSTSKSTFTPDDAVERADGVGDAGLEVAADRAAGRREGDGDVDDAVGVSVDRADHAERDDVLAQLGVDDGAQRLADLVLGRHASHCGRRFAASAAALKPGSLKTDGTPVLGAPAVEGGEGAAFAGEEYGPANPTRVRRPPHAPIGGSLVSQTTLARRSCAPLTSFMPASTPF